MKTKICTWCKKIKDISLFFRNNRNKSGLDTHCKVCRGEKNKLVYRRTIEKRRHERRVYYQKNRDHILKKQKEWDENNRDKVYANIRRYCKRHPEKVRDIQVRWQAAHPGKVKEYQKRTHQRLLSTPRGKLLNSIRRGIHKTISQGSKKRRHWEGLVGYTVEQLKKHLEKQFIDGMTWDNYGEWHIDHIIPINAFNFSTPEDIDFNRCWALKNLRPLWKVENLRKHDKVDKPFQPSLEIAVPTLCLQN